MGFIQESVQNLSARLPELEWKLVALNITLSSKKLPAGLFYDRFELTPQTCIDEIKANLRILDALTNERSARYLADNISQKINILVRLCQLQTDRAINKPLHNFGVKTMSTRQQWLQTLQQDIAKLKEQQQALILTLNTLQLKNDVVAILSLKASLGEVERQLTVAKETYTRATTKFGGMDV